MPSTRLHTSLPARPGSIGRLRRVVADYARRTGADPDTVQALRLAVSEALTNVAMHAYRGREPGEMLAEAWREDDELIVRVWDDGIGLIPRPDSPGMGIGLAVMAQVSDHFTISNREDASGTLVELRFGLSTAASELSQAPAGGP